MSRKPPASLLAVLLLVPAAACWLERVPREEGNDEPSPAEAVPEMLHRSADAWNAGDLSGFLEPYRQGTETTYIGSSGLRQGSGEIRTRYAPLFRPGAERDSLRFVDLRVRQLDGDHALAVGRYVLHREGRRTDTGMFTLVLEEFDEGWRIVHDHSSAVPFPGDTAGGGTGTGG